MNKIKYVTILGAILMLILAACGKETHTAEPINEATDVCEICKMSISDNQYATQLKLKNGEVKKFDDLGCHYEWKQQHGDEEIVIEFVRDFHTKEWINADHAYYVYDSSFETPMAYGMVSFEKKADAEKFIAEHEAGQLLTVKELASHTWEANHSHNHDHGDGHGHDHDEEHGDEHDGDHGDGHGNH